MNELSDPLEVLLQPVASDDPVGIRERLREATSRFVGRRRVIRRLALAAAIAACLLAAASIWYFAWPAHHSLPNQPLIADLPWPAQPLPAEVVDELTPLALEWRAFDSQDNRVAAYFLAGNKYLEASNDLESALRCYRQALDSCTEEELEITPDDNWLVASLKNARRKENVHD